MKRLTLVCECGASRTFMGRDAKAIIQKIDASGWYDLPGGGGRCPKCERKYNAETEDRYRAECDE